MHSLACRWERAGARPIRSCTRIGRNRAARPVAFVVIPSPVVLRGTARPCPAGHGPVSGRCGCFFRQPAGAAGMVRHTQAVWRHHAGPARSSRMRLHVDMHRSSRQMPAHRAAGVVGSGCAAAQPLHRDTGAGAPPRRGSGPGSARPVKWPGQVPHAAPGVAAPVSGSFASHQPFSAPHTFVMAVVALGELFPGTAHGKGMGLPQKTNAENKGDKHVFHDDSFDGEMCLNGMTGCQAATGVRPPALPALRRRRRSSALVQIVPAELPCIRALLAQVFALGGFIRTHGGFQ